MESPKENLLNVVSTGVEGLDRVLEGGFPRNSLIVLAGNPGTGKTIFSAQFLYCGAVDYGESGVYVSFAEDHESFIQNMRNFGFDFKRLEEKGKFSFLEFLTMEKEAASTIVNMILREISKINAKRLVIDSYSALAQMLEKPLEARKFLHTVLGRITRLLGCTTLLIVEIPFGQERIGLGIEGFVADGILQLRAGRLEGRSYRDLLIRKMRGVEVKEERLGFTLHGGFKVFTPFKMKTPERKEAFKPMPNPPGRFTSCSESLDRLLGGGWPQSSTVLLEIGENVSALEYHLLIVPTGCNFLARESGVIIIPSSGIDYNIVWSQATESGLPKEILEKCLRVCIFRTLATVEKPWLIKLDGENAIEDFQGLGRLARSFIELTGKPPLWIVGADTLIMQYGLEEAVKLLSIGATMIREAQALGFFILKPGYPRTVSQLLNSIVDIHLKIVREHGALILYGLKPRTCLNFLEADFSKGCPLPKLTPIR